MKEMAADTVELIKEKLTIQDVVAPYVKLTRAGKYLKGLSPFNKEKTPSFFVNPERGSYYCFSSSQGGDMFTFIQKMEGVDFKGALKILAEKAGVEIVYGSGGGKERKEKLDRLREAVARAEQYFSRALTEDSPAYAYARSRGLAADTIQAWGLGFAPDGWRGLLEDLERQGYATAELIEAGLVKEADGKPGTYYDRFRNRLMFPIRDAAGRTVGFTGRALSSDDQAKYLNSPETELFKKSQILFAMDRAKDAIRTRGYALLMEGQMDVLHAHQAGFENTVGISGTALSLEHLSLLMRYSENLMLALDGDRAGLMASHKHALSALRAGMRVKAVRLPIGEDPADCITKDPKDFAKRVADAPSIIEFFLAALAERETDTLRLAMQAEKTVLPLLAAIRSPIEREHFVGVVARAISSTPDAVRASLAAYARGEAPAGKPSAAPSSLSEARVPDDVLLAALVAAYPDTPLANRVKNEYARIVSRPLPDEAVPEHVEFSTGILYGEAPPEHAADDILKRLERTTLALAYDGALAALRQAEASRDPAAIRAAETVCNDLRKAIALLPN